MAKAKICPTCGKDMSKCKCDMGKGKKPMKKKGGYK